MSTFRFHIYDLSQGAARTYSGLLNPDDPEASRVDAIYHSGIVAYGYEYYFEGSVARRSAGRTRFGPAYSEAVNDLLYRTTKTQAEFEMWIKHTDIGNQEDGAGGGAINIPGWGSFGLLDYRAISHNCHVFCDAAAKFLTDGAIGAPECVTNNVKRLLSFPSAGIVAGLLERLAGGIVYEMGRTAHRAIATAESAKVSMLWAIQASNVESAPPAAIFVPRPWLRTAADQGTNPVWWVLKDFVVAATTDAQKKAHDAGKRTPSPQTVANRISEYLDALQRDITTVIPVNACALLCDAICISLAYCESAAEAAANADSPKTPMTASPSSHTCNSTLKVRSRANSMTNTPSRAAAKAPLPEEDLEPFATTEGDIDAAPTNEPFAETTDTGHVPALAPRTPPQAKLSSSTRFVRHVTRAPGTCVDGKAAERLVQRHGKRDFGYLIGIVRAWTHLQLNAAFALAAAQHATLLDLLEELLEPELAGLWPDDALAAILDLVCAMFAHHASGSFLRQRFAPLVVSLMAAGLFSREWSIVDRAASLYNNMVLLFRSYTLSSIEAEMDRQGFHVPLGNATMCALLALRTVFPPAAILVEHPKLFARPSPLSTCEQLAESKTLELSGGDVAMLIAREQVALQKLLAGVLHFGVEGDNPMLLLREPGIGLDLEQIGERCITPDAHNLRRLLASHVWPPDDPMINSQQGQEHGEGDTQET
jgi:hypothetical protein